MQKSLKEEKLLHTIPPPQIPRNTNISLVDNYGQLCMSQVPDGTGTCTHLDVRMYAYMHAHMYVCMCACLKRVCVCVQSWQELTTLKEVLAVGTYAFTTLFDYLALQPYAAMLYREGVNRTTWNLEVGGSSCLADGEKACSDTGVHPAAWGVRLSKINCTQLYSTSELHITSFLAYVLSCGIKIVSVDWIC